jgi:hypothetical protein
MPILFIEGYEQMQELACSLFRRHPYPSALIDVSLTKYFALSTNHTFDTSVEATPREKGFCRHSTELMQVSARYIGWWLLRRTALWKPHHDSCHEFRGVMYQNTARAFKFELESKDLRQVGRGGPVWSSSRLQGGARRTCSLS